jgi:hypothetical protein
MSGLPPGADMSMTGRFAPEAADQRSAAWLRSKVKTVLKLWSSARYRATRRAGWRRNCHAYAAISVRGISWKFGGPTLQGEVFQFGDNFINDDITDYSFKAGDPP